jgi:2-methylcitrate dehydratase
VLHSLGTALGALDAEPVALVRRLRIRLRDGCLLERSKCDYEASTRWETVVAKFERLSAPFADEQLRRRTIDAVAPLEHIDIQELSVPLERAGRQSTETAMTR